MKALLASYMEGVYYGTDCKSDAYRSDFYVKSSEFKSVKEVGAGDCQ